MAAQLRALTLVSPAVLRHFSVPFSRRSVLFRHDSRSRNSRVRSRVFSHVPLTAPPTPVRGGCPRTRVAQPAWELGTALRCGSMARSAAVRDRNPEDCRPHSYTPSLTSAALMLEGGSVWEGESSAFKGNHRPRQTEPCWRRLSVPCPVFRRGADGTPCWTPRRRVHAMLC